MAKVVMVDGSIEIEDVDVPGLSLPESLTPTFVQQLLGGDITDTVIPSVFPYLSPADKRRVVEVCAAHPELDQLYRTAAGAWASVACLDQQGGDWDLATIKLRYRKHVRTSLLSMVVLTDDGRWMGVNANPRLSRVAFTDAEFAFHYGQSLAEHLRSAIKVYTIGLTTLAEAIEQPLVTAELQVQTSAGLSIKHRRGPAGVKVALWELEPGETFVCEIACTPTPQN